MKFIDRIKNFFKPAKQDSKISNVNEKYSRIYETPFGTQYAMHDGAVYYRKVDEFLFRKSCIEVDDLHRYIDGGLIKLTHSRIIYTYNQ
ncbi:hypothetical protein [Hafnia phage Pocis76]|uniref:Uncharacterized protein n=1 Tax=Hafnia phage Pocis76 TaxID=2831174 RepID=A0A8E7FNQ1_9CAUD|nr:hypothetical protein [Hafnia phage Pocis76]